MMSDVSTPIALLQAGFWKALIYLLLLIGPCLLIGLLVSIVQAATHIQEQTLSFLPKLMVILLLLYGLGGWMLNDLSNFMQTVYFSFVEAATE